MKKKLGFTLVEIMIVVAIIALLTAIAIPAFLQYRRDARTSLCVNNMRNIEHAKETYAISRNLGETDPVYWTNITAYIGQGIDELFCPEQAGTTPDTHSYFTQESDAHPSVGDVSGTNRVWCKLGPSDADAETAGLDGNFPGSGAFPRHIYRPGLN